MSKPSIERLQSKQLDGYQESTKIKLYTGASMIVGGFALLIMGITGSVEIVVDAMNIKGKLINASPGVVFSFLGFLIVVTTRHRVFHNQSYTSGPDGVLKIDSGINVVHGMAGDQSGSLVPEKRKTPNVKQ